MQVDTGPAHEFCSSSGSWKLSSGFRGDWKNARQGASTAIFARGSSGHVQRRLGLRGRLLGSVWTVWAMWWGDLLFEGRDWVFRVVLLSFLLSFLNSTVIDHIQDNEKWRLFCENLSAKHFHIPNYPSIMKQRTRIFWLRHPSEEICTTCWEF